MSLSDLASIATIVQGIFVNVSISFIWYQLHETTRLTRAANTQNLMGLSSPFNLQLIQDREMATLWVNGAAQYDKMDTIDKRRYHELLIWWLMLHENIYHQQRERLVNKETYIAWTHDLEGFVTEQRLGQQWDRMKDFFEPSFAEHVSRIIANRSRKIENQQGEN